ncbi:protein RADIALIS-like 4, partial [Sesamum indicum]|uniref:Protein RADIALIS-like 4 n=1 Tax=Sesamum indicum TaxID=4182 RepID=A0A6I9SKI0_SESIN
QQQSVDSAAAVWSRQEDKILEQALVEFPEGIDHWWRRIAEFLPSKSPDEVRLHYEALLHDIVEIDSGRVELPGYSDESAPLGWDEARPRVPGQISLSGGNHSRHSEVERKKGRPWTEDEHRFDGLLHLHHG